MTAGVQRKPVQSTREKLLCLTRLYRDHRNTEVSGSTNWFQVNVFGFYMEDPLPEVWVGPQENQTPKQQIIPLLSCAQPAAQGQLAAQGSYKFCPTQNCKLI